MRIETDKTGRVIGWSLDDLANEQMFSVSCDIPKDFEENAFFYRYEDGSFIFDPKYKEEYTNGRIMAEIRDKRQTVCFPIVNRGNLWYDLLSDGERAELMVWYKAWLDAPETLIEPEMPEWLKEV